MKHSQSPFQAMAIVSVILSQLAGGAIGGVFLGKWVDSQFSTAPLFLIIGLLFGIGSGTYGTIHLVRSITGDD
ncbi:AtpZ/AtpI family protein [Halobacillus massiliensis]|uniref:AtpZ/AtpI family protein n=1 Tax=Halobacillus massiliensis TaxID=1926286 RepID=UPI0009E373EC|nr:AtpZ/AtpI family protein [Halobacillus massiliensis]